ncbi:MAG: vanadium-dependent haloperoxidase [Sphingomicrobium sp.]
MKIRRKQVRLAAIGLATVVVPATAHADVVTDWAEFAVRLENASDDHSAEGYATNAQIGAAMFEAANCIDHRYRSYLGMTAVPKGSASLDAAVIAAAHAVLVAHYTAKKAMIDENEAVALELIPDTPARAKGIAIGEDAARQALLRGGLDAAVIQVPYRPRTTPGMWIGATLPVFAPYVQALKPWAIGRVDALRPPPPPALTSAIYTSSYDEVKRLGGKVSAERTPLQTRMASYRITPDLMPMLRRISDLPGRTTVGNTRMVARLWMAEADYGLAMADAKMHYQFWRPITAIRNAADDANPATAPDPGWMPLIPTPNHPEYPCGHCGYAAMAAAVLRAEVGNSPPGGVVVQSRSLPDAVLQHLPTFDEWVRQVSFSRTLGGVHFRFSNEAGEQMGDAVAAKVLALMPAEHGGR